MRICIVLPDIMGRIRNGGVGTACTVLAQFLVAEDHEVTLFYSSDHFETGDAAHWRSAYARSGIATMFLETASLPPLHRMPTVHAGEEVARSVQVYEVLRGHGFDVIRFVDHVGLGYFTALARSQGLALGRTRIVVTAHAPTLWSRLSNGRTLDDIAWPVRDRMERRLVELADHLVSPSAYMIRWMEENGWAVPSRRHVIQNLLPQSLEAPAAVAVPPGGGE